MTDYIAHPWKHPAVRDGRHVVRMTRDYPNGGPAFSVATCDCGWSVRAQLALGCLTIRDRAIRDHWLGVIAAAEGKVCA